MGDDIIRIDNCTYNKMKIKVVNINGTTITIREGDLTTEEFIPNDYIVKPIIIPYNADSRDNDTWTAYLDSTKEDDIGNYKII